ncbi:MAG: oligosaccharyl transferase, archaeosortase A system-associated [Methanotrichaceae archaeon]|nr:oligosaccharyl transferase, archaeosortase A system-associated [Methanotrichaceae archaeon]
MDGGKRIESLELAVIIVLAFLLRLLAGRPSLSETGVLLAGFDSYYHMRRILYMVNHFPNTLWSDTYIDYPNGFNITWPPLYDQISATASLILGQHAQQGVEMVSAFLPVVFGILTIVVVYFMVREVFGRDIALLSAFLAALSPSFIFNSMVGATDHHSLEVLFLLASLLFMVLAFSRKEKRYIFAGFAGIFLAGLAYNWFGTIIYLGIFLLYAAVQITLDLRGGSSLKETPGTLLTSFVVALILILPYWNTTWLSLSFFGIIMAIFAIIILFIISYIIAKRNIKWYFFPSMILIIIFIFYLFGYLQGDLFIGNIGVKQGIEFIFGGGGIGISEAMPLFSGISPSSLIFSYLGWTLLFSLAGIIAFIYVLQKSGKEINKGQLLILVWGIASILLTLGQSRFLYMSSIAFGILISILFFQLIELLEKRMSEKKQKLPKALVIGLLLILILPTLAETIDAAKGLPFSIAGDWYDSLNWLKTNSNSTSFYDDPKAVPEYSVMSKWDYGNWIIQVAERPVVANNFQVGLRDSFKFFLSEDEDAATSLLDKKRSKYIIIDYDMLYTKLPVMLRWANKEPSDYFTTEEYGSSVAFMPLPKLLNTTLARLYLFDGAGAGHFRLLHESSTRIGTQPPKSKVKIFEYVPGVLIKVNTGSDQRVGALLNLTSNQDRDFVYVNEGSYRDGRFEIRVPYSTEDRYETHALGPYLIFSGNEKGVRMQNINITEQDILDGKIIEVNF